MIAVAAIAIVVYLLLPLSAADQRLMSIYEQLGNNEPKANLTTAQVISQIGPPSGIGIRTPKQCTPYTCVGAL